MKGRIASRRWTTANGLTTLRFVLTFPIVAAIGNGNTIAAVALMAVAAWSDVADGAVARRTGTASARGALWDVGADTTLVLAVQVRLCVTREWPPYLLVMSVCSILTFLLLSADARNVTRNTIGKYTGGVLMGAMCLHLLLIAVSPGSSRTAVKIAGPLIGAFITLSIVENLHRSIRAQREQS